MAGWRVVDCSGVDGSVHSRRGQLVVRRDGQDDEVVPTEDVAVLLVGSRVVLGPSVLQRCAMDDITLLATDWRGVPLGAAHGWNLHGRIAARHRAQAELSLPRRKNAWAQIVRAKVMGQATALESVGSLKKAESLRALARTVRSGDPANVEATAARAYWPALFADRGFRRLPGQSADTMNSCLDYGYGVLRGYGIRAALAAGLSTALGLFHRNRSNYFNLVDDLIEPFRPVVDLTVATLPAHASLEHPAVKHALVGCLTRRFDAGGLTVPSVLEVLAQRLGRYVEGDTSRLEVPVWEVSDEPDVIF